MTEVPDAATPDRLTATLRRAGVLEDGSVSAVAVERSWPTLLSRLTRLRLTYSGASPTAPPTLIHKTGLPDRLGNAAWDAGRQEVAFYNDVAAALPTTPVPRCFEAAWDPDTRAWHLLLEDLTDSHFVATTWPLPPTIEHCERVVRAHARFKAAWWDDDRLGTSIGSWPPPDGRHLDGLAEGLPRFFDHAGDRLPPHRRDLYNSLFEQRRQLTKRYHTRKNFTVVQGDAHFWNCLLPSDDGADARLFDWDCWRIDVGTDDLAYMIAMHWYPDRRRLYERRLLDCYHETLLANGVQDYDRRSVDDDYRLSVLWQLLTPLGQANANIPPVIWWNNLERILLAIDDLGCRKLLE